ncbi:MAG: bifunctional riboflavin kinase/FAD synthetase [Candidatus Omnitrophica bacterium]|nr:bifunctional riboflavin kinase/FAD synthetase [Candidatus Omnitrophota bacterium]
MKVFFCQSPIISKKNSGDCLASFGVFDGLHKGHIYLLNKFLTQAKKRKFKSLLITFWPHPLDFYGRKFLGYLTTYEERIDILRRLSLDYLWVIKFNQKIAELRGSQFIDYLLKYFKIKKFIVGEDLRFGYRREEGIRDLRDICKEREIEVEVIKKLKIGGRSVSSSLIRNLIRKAELSLVKKFLGRFYSLKAKVIRGEKKGARVLGIPTVNLDPDKKILPPSGVYFTLTKYKNKLYPSLTNIGRAPTLKEKNKKIILETHIINFNKNIYKDTVEVFFLKRLRREKKFKSALNLKFQILKDIESSRKFFSSLNIL